jgi:hypothetical protein
LAGTAAILDYSHVSRFGDMPPKQWVENIDRADDFQFRRCAASSGTVPAKVVLIRFCIS